jgi:broad specificity phosphatase PhoE
VWTGILPGGETLAAAAARADRVIDRIRATDGDALVFGHGHLSRILAARWCGQPPGMGAHLLLDAASISVLSYERATPAIRSWNRTLDQLAGQR